LGKKKTKLNGKVKFIVKDKSGKIKKIVKGVIQDV